VWKAANNKGGQPVEKKIGFATSFFFHLSRDCRKKVLTKFAAHHAAGSVGHGSRLGRCDREVREGGSNQPFGSFDRAVPDAWLVMPGIAGR
jgi:hypothetical protein